jgi:hypothetical protein
MEIYLENDDFSSKKMITFENFLDCFYTLMKIIVVQLVKMTIR